MLLRRSLFQCVDRKGDESYVNVGRGMHQNLHNITIIKALLSGIVTFSHNTTASRVEKSFGETLGLGRLLRKWFNDGRISRECSFKRRLLLIITDFLSINNNGDWDIACNLNCSNYILIFTRADRCSMARCEKRVSRQSRTISDSQSLQSLVETSEASYAIGAQCGQRQNEILIEFHFLRRRRRQIEHH